MASDWDSNAPVPAFSKDLGKKKRTNRLAKLKQCKLDVRREQWLAQVKNKGCNVDSNGTGGSLPTSVQISNERNRSLENLETRSRGMENEDEGLTIHDSDLEPWMNSPTGSSFGHNGSRKQLPGSSRSSSSGCLGSASEEEEDDGCLDDWEAVADALTSDDHHTIPVLEPPAQPELKVIPANANLPNKKTGVGSLKTESRGMVAGSQPNCRAWRPDDAFRPQCLPNLSKQHCFPLNSEWHCGGGAIPWAWQSIVSQPSSCPICFEDLDLTDSSFLPCSCGFRLCLFCHKRILEADGRCPGCRKQYDHITGDVGLSGVVTPLQMTHSCSMSTRS